MTAVDRPMRHVEVEALAQARHPSNAYADTTQRVFALLVDVADCYVAHLEQHPAAQIHPAPFVGWTTPLEAAMQGLRQALVDQREGRLPQHR